ncbi:hypothetical protein BT67DRAFT_448188 [Trichocladium antarcticum]|uniref:CFEM domain-containing protein n=1 Tax=Trichocladium antarcticum TaxID=1450529 RepID=A0AAN6US74_9PEZI|nr:hypothetical protein BT67DRAFT_448188 [Trichocladium antarcticum]
MKTITLFLAAAGMAVAQNFSGQPACATACLSSAISAAGCAPDDTGCQCGPTKAVIGASAAPCLIKSCTSGTDLLDAQRAGETQCTSYSATASPASPSATTTAASSSASSASPASSGSTVPSVASNTSSGTDIEETSMPASGAAESSQTSAPAPASTGSTSSQSTGAAAVATPAAMGFGALLGVLGAVAAL